MMMPQINSDPDPIDVFVGGRLRSIRKQQEMSQSELALGAGISFQQVQKYESGANRISASMLCRLAQHLRVTVNDLLPPECGGFSSGLSARALAGAKLINQMSDEAQKCTVSMLQKLAIADAHDGRRNN